MTHPLDRPVWSALASRQADLAIGGATAKRFPPDIGPFAAAIEATSKAVADLAALMSPAGLALAEVAPPAPPPGVAAEAALCFQMTARAIAPDGKSVRMAPLADADAAEMRALAELTKPGPFLARTNTLGRFLGVRDQGRLIAMAGERMHLEGFREISAVCTHPNYRGRGLGAALMKAVGARILAEGETPFLHTYADNDAAIALYRGLGFSVRAEIRYCIWTHPVQARQ